MLRSKWDTALVPRANVAQQNAVRPSPPAGWRKPIHLLGMYCPGLALPSPEKPMAQKAFGSYI